MTDASPDTTAPATAGTPYEYLQQKFPGVITPDTRESYQGVIVEADHLIEVASAIRDDLGYDLLSNIGYVDYLAEGFLETVYHAYRVSTGGPALNFKARAPRENAVIPSLTSVWPSADFQEREAWDLMGIRFNGHPNLKRILMWEGFEGHPLRKDWHEPFYEDAVKPFKSRWPDGHVVRAEYSNLYGRNVQYPAGFSLDGYTPEGEEAVYAGLDTPYNQSGVGVNQIRTDQLVVNMGPQHPSTHGVFRMAVTVDGETVTKLEPVMGYLHRNHEKIGERNTWLQNMPYTDRLDYITSMSNNLAYAITVEKLMGQEVTYRAEVIRVLMAELTRIISHVWLFGFLLNDLGAFLTPAVYAITERDLVLDFFEAVSGSRMMCNYMRFGGVAYDLPPYVGGPAIDDRDRARRIDTMKYIKDLIYDRIPRVVDEMDAYLTTNEILMARCQGVGVLTPEKAVAYGVTGPLLRASGVPYDLRRADPYSIYNELDFDIPVRYNGDLYDRYLIRLDEVHQSLRILQQIVPRLEETQGQEYWAGKRAYNVRVPKGEHYGHAENPKGELGFYVVSDGSANPYRYHIRSSSFINLTALEEMCIGHKVADVVAILGAVDIVLGEVDR
ncbi:MAG: NADH-quinone oxidoreductase subunit D [Anaerolineae bacterium]|nr:NADH-quinone oxidoreductase subunit D [Anaerolineae bacterium]